VDETNGSTGSAAQAAAGPVEPDAQHPAEAPGVRPVIPENLAVPGAHIQRIPCGVWVRRPGGRDLSADELHSEPPQDDRVFVVVGAPAEQHPSPRVVANVVRALPKQVREVTVLSWYGGPVQAAEVAQELNSPVRAVHGVPSGGSMIFVDERGAERWQPWVEESLFEPGKSPKAQRWVAPPGLTKIEMAAYRLADGWRLDVVPRGLLVRPDSVPARAEWQGETGSFFDVLVVSAPGTDLPTDVVKSLDDVLDIVPPEDVPCLRILPVGPTAGRALALSRHAVVVGEPLPWPEGLTASAPKPGLPIVSASSEGESSADADDSATAAQADEPGGQASAGQEHEPAPDMPGLQEDEAGQPTDLAAADDPVVVEDVEEFDEQDVVVDPADEHATGEALADEPGASQPGELENADTDDRDEYDRDVLGQDDSHDSGEGDVPDDEEAEAADVVDDSANHHPKDEPEQADDAKGQARPPAPVFVGSVPTAWKPPSATTYGAMAKTAEAAKTPRAAIVAEPGQQVKAAEAASAPEVAIVAEPGQQAKAAEAATAGTTPAGRSSSAAATSTPKQPQQPVGGAQPPRPLPKWDAKHPGVILPSRPAQSQSPRSGGSPAGSPARPPGSGDGPAESLATTGPTPGGSWVARDPDGGEQDRRDEAQEQAKERSPAAADHLPSGRVAVTQDGRVIPARPILVRVSFRPAPAPLPPPPKSRSTDGTKAKAESWWRKRLFAKRRGDEKGSRPGRATGKASPVAVAAGLHQPSGPVTGSFPVPAGPPGPPPDASPMPATDAPLAASGATPQVPGPYAGQLGPGLAAQAPCPSGQVPQGAADLKSGSIDGTPNGHGTATTNQPPTKPPSPSAASQAFPQVPAHPEASGAPEPGTPPASLVVPPKRLGRGPAATGPHGATTTDTPGSARARMPGPQPRLPGQLHPHAPSSLRSVQRTTKAPGQPVRP
jgi:hypothetical protein